MRYQIKDWDVHFENNKSRERDKCSWCPIPNKQDGLGYGRLLRMRDGVALYGAFVAVVLVCSKQNRPRHGHLTDTGRADGRPLDAECLSIMTQIPIAVIDRMLKACSDVSVGWLIAYDGSARVVPAECPPSAQEGKEGKEEKEKKEEAFDGLIPDILKDDRFIASWHCWVLDRASRRKPITEDGARLQLSKLKDFGIERAIRSIDKSIECGWTGLFDPDAGAKVKPVRKSMPEFSPEMIG